MVQQLTTLQKTDLRINGELFPYSAVDFTGDTLTIYIGGSHYET